MTDTRDALARLWTGLGHDPVALAQVDLTGSEPVLPSSFAVGRAMQASVAASALAAAEIWRARTGKAQRIGVDMRAAAIASRSERYFTVDGGPTPELWDKIAGAYQCGDGRYVRLHTNFPHHRDGVLALLKVRLRQGRGRANLARMESLRRRGCRRAIGPRRHRDAVVCGMGRASARASREPTAAVVAGAHRRRSPLRR